MTFSLALQRFSPWPMLLALLLLDPLAMSLTLDGTGRMEVSWPRVRSGDEPHYLVMVHSLLNDGDLDVANNYGSVHSGSGEAGAYFAGSALDHHVVWYHGDHLQTWWRVFENDPARWQRDALGRPLPTPRNDVPLVLPEHEYSWHPPGMPLLLCGLMQPLRGTSWIEPGALCCSALAVVTAMFAFRMLIDPYATNSNVLWMSTLVAFLGTPTWHYGRTLFCEPYLLACAVAAYALALRRSAFLLAGALIALGILMKPPFALLAIPLAADAFRAGAPRHIWRLLTPIVLSVAAILALNLSMHGSCFKSPIQWESGSILRGSAGLLFSHDHGLLPFAPAVAMVAAAWPCFFRSHRRDATVLLSGVCLYFCLMAAWISWKGSTCYGPRMIVPAIPLMFAALPFVPQCKWWRNRAAKVAAIGACGCSVAINALGAIWHGCVWDRHPVVLLYEWLAT